MNPTYAVGGLAGQQLGDYVLETRIGRGGMADVYRARHITSQRRVAIKVINYTASFDDEVFERRFAQEAKLVASLEHLHIVPVYDYGIAPINEGVAYIVMRMMAHSLSDVMRVRRLTLMEAVQIFEQIARALSYSHQEGVVHRDIKPSNILLDEYGNAYLTDFGLAKILQSSLNLTKTGLIVGAPAYSAPEQLIDDPIDQRADIYAMGGLMYHLLTGRAPFEHVKGDIAALINSQLHDQPPPLHEINPTVPGTFEILIARAMQKSPNQRYQDAQRMIDALHAALFLGEIELRSPPVAENFNPLLGFMRLNRLAIIAAMAMGVLMIVIGGVFVQPRLTNRTPRPTISANAVGVAADVVPTDAELALARERMGSDGFVALVICSLYSQFQAVRAREMGELLSAYGIAYRVYDSAMNSRRQAAQINEAANSGAAAFILCPLEESTIDDALRGLRRRNLPVVLLTPLSGSYGGVTIEPENDAAGRLGGVFAGEWINAELDGQAQVILLTYPGLQATDARADGLKAGLFSAAPRADLVGEYSIASDDVPGYDTVMRLLSDGQDFDVILSISDAVAIGAARALSDYGVPYDAAGIISIDGELSALHYLQRGFYVRGVVALARTETAQAGVHSIVKLLGDGTLPAILTVPPEGVIHEGNLPDG